MVCCRNTIKSLSLHSHILPWWWNGRHEGLKQNLSACPERDNVECRKFKETLTGNAEGNLEPSLLKEEGAETRHDTPKGSFPTVKE